MESQLEWTKTGREMSEDHMMAIIRQESHTRVMVAEVVRSGWCFEMGPQDFLMERI